MNNTEKIRSLQAQIKAMQDANQDAISLMAKINKETDVIAEDTEKDLVKLKEQIRKDLEELKSFSDPDIYATRNINIYDIDNKYGLHEDGQYAVIHPRINLGVGGEYEFDKMKGVSEVTDIAVCECCHTYAPIFRDGVFADEEKKHDVRPKELNAFYRHWPAILVIAYEEMLKAYKDKATKDLKNALNKKSAALKKQMDIKAALMAATE